MPRYAGEYGLLPLPSQPLAGDSNATFNPPLVNRRPPRSLVQIEGPQPLAGEQAARVQLRNCDLRIGSVCLIGDLRTFVPIPYAALPQGPSHGTWPSGRQALKASTRCCRPAAIAALGGPVGRAARPILRSPASSTASRG